MEYYISRLNDAYNRLNCATDFEEVDIAIYEIIAAEMALSRYLKLQKEKCQK